MNNYLAAAYLVFLALLLIYVVIMAVRQSRLQQEVLRLEAELRERDEAPRDREMTPV